MAEPLRVTIEHDAAVAPSDKLEILVHQYPADRAVTTLTYVVGDEVKATVSLFVRNSTVVRYFPTLTCADVVTDQ